MSVINFWLSTDAENLLVEQQPLPVKKPGKKCSYKIVIDSENKFQQMTGFGASFTDSSAYLLQKCLTDAERAVVFQKLFTPVGINLSFIRDPMGSCDYNLNIWTYCDTGELCPPDPLLKNFSIQYDQKYILPCLKKALELNPKIFFMATPWTAPAWMKSSGSAIGGQLLPECYQAYALYFVKFIQAYAKEGIEVQAITLQNEPLFTPLHYPGMFLGAEAARDFVKTALGPLFARYNIATKIFIYDHNWDRPDYPLTVLEDDDARKYISGVAWHVYGGSPDAMTLVHDKYPEIETHFTEASGGEWIPEFREAWLDQTAQIIRVPRNWSKTFSWWNIALDEQHGPSLLGDWSTCRGLLCIDRKTGAVKYELDYYTLGHLSKFVQPGAYRIASNQWFDELENVAFLNPDGSKVLLVSNRTAAVKNFSVEQANTFFEYKLPPEACATFVWK